MQKIPSISMTCDKVTVKLSIFWSITMPDNIHEDPLEIFGLGQVKWNKNLSLSRRSKYHGREQRSIRE
ncbi:hypothetical protein AYI68_g1402 [Smittium mucronatum]|uniref:Uncharacterized protein n=1 Tax=Smittium mucronatum TaxID=133383 RepID=A0A1R0H5G8_9FUNG|nr:hypothetical protein AYI68_g1402 [Smittium mucronatum]